MLLSAGTEGDGLRVISRLLLINILKHSSTFLHSRNTHAPPRYTPTPFYSPFLRPFIAYIFFCSTFLSLCLFLATSFSLIHPGGLSGCQQEHRAPQRTPPLLQSAPHKSNKTRLCKYFSGFGTSSRVPLLAVCWPSVRAIVWPNGRLFCAVCCRTWLVCCGEAAVPACMQWQRRGLGFDVSLCPSGCHARSSALARRAQFTSFSPVPIPHQAAKSTSNRLQIIIRCVRGTS